MPFDAGQTPILYDFSGVPVASGYAPITGRPATAMPSPAGGMIQLGSDYGSTPKAQVPHIDANGTAYVQAASPNGAPAYVYTSQAPPAVTSQYGPLSMLRQDLPSPAQFAPLLGDQMGNLLVRQATMPTFRAIARGVTAAQNRYLFCLVNGASSGVVIRLNVVMVYVTPPGVAGALLGSNSATYYPLICELYRVPASAVTAGTTVTAAACDSNNTLNSGVSVSSTPTISSYTASLYRQDAVAVVTSGESFYQRDDPNNQALVIRPGEGIALICLSNGTIGTAAGGTATAAPDIQFIFSQAPA